MDAGKALWALLTDPRRFGRTLYFNPEVLEFRLGTDTWGALETLLGLEEAGLLKLSAPAEFTLLYDYELARIQATNFLGLKPYEELVNDFKRLWLMGRVLKFEPPRQLGVRIPDHAEKFKILNTHLNKLLKLMEAKALVSREVYNKVMQSACREAAASSKDVKELVKELNDIVAVTTRLLNRVREGRKNVEEISSKLGIRTEEHNDLVNTYNDAEQGLLYILMNVKTKVKELIQSWEQVIGNYNKMKAEFSIAGQDFFSVLDYIIQINNSFTVVTQQT